MENAKTGPNAGPPPGALRKAGKPGLSRRRAKALRWVAFGLPGSALQWTARGGATTVRPTARVGKVTALASALRHLATRLCLATPLRLAIPNNRGGESVFMLGGAPRTWRARVIRRDRGP